MKHKGKFNSPAKGVKKKQMEKKVNAFTPTKKNNNGIMINDPDTQLSIVEKRRYSAKDSKPVKSSDRSFPSSLDVSKHSINKSGESSNIDSGNGNIEDTDAITKKEDQENARKLTVFVRKVLSNELPREKMEMPLYLMIESKQSVKISQQDFQNMIINKAAEVMATKSHYANQLDRISMCEEQQLLYYEKYKQLLNDINTMNAELDLLNRMPCTAVKHVRNVGTNVKM